MPIYQSKTHQTKALSKITKTQKKAPEIVEYNSNEEVNFYSFNKTQPMPFGRMFAQTNKQTQRGKQHEYKIQRQNLRNDSPEKQFTNLSDQAASLNVSIDTNFNFNSIAVPNVPLSPSFNDQYYAHLTKSNPSFALLYSDVGSLSPEQKTLLIEALSKDHKDKTIQLLFQHSKLKKMKQVLNENASNYQKQIQIMTSQMEHLVQCQAFNKQYFSQLENENERMNDLIKGLSADIKRQKQVNWQHKQAALKKDNHIKMLEADLKTKNQQNQYFQQCQQIGQKIKEMAGKRRKKETLIKIISRAKQYKKIQEWKNKRLQKQNITLLNISWSLIKKHLLVQILAKMKIEEKASSLVKICFKAWKKQTKNEKLYQKKQQLLKKYLIKKNLEGIHNLFKRRSNNKKESKLHDFWADRHLLKSQFYKLSGKVKVSKQNEQIKKSFAQNHHLMALKNSIFNHLKQFALSTNSKAQSISKKLSYKKKSLFYRNLQKMFQSKLLLQQKESKVELIGKLLQYKIAGKKKLTAIANLIKQSQTLKAKTQQVAEIRNYGCKQYFFNQFLNIQQTEKGNHKASKKLHQTLKKMKLKRFLRRAKKYFSIAKKLGELVIKYKQQCVQVDAIENFKMRKIQEKIRGDKIKKVLKNLTKNKYIQRMVDIEFNKRIEMEETKQFIDKMKVLNDIQMEAIKNQHSKHLQILEQEQTQKEIDYRNQILISENKNLELEDTLKLLKNDLQTLQQKDFFLTKEKQLIREQMVLAEHGKDQLKALNESLLINNEELQTKYNRMLELYTQAVIQLERKDKTNENYQKDRDKTVEKDKRHIGLARNGDFVSLRSRMF